MTVPDFIKSPMLRVVVPVVPDIHITLPAPDTKNWVIGGVAASTLLHNATPATRSAPSARFNCVNGRPSILTPPTGELTLPTRIWPDIVTICPTRYHDKALYAPVNVMLPDVDGVNVGVNSPRLMLLISCHESYNICQYSYHGRDVRCMNYHH